MKTIKQSLLALSIATAVALPASLASADGFYIGAGAYKADMDFDQFDDDDTVPAAFIGYQFIDSNIFMFSAELGYYDLGDFESKNKTVEIEADALTLAAVAYFPIGPIFEVYAKAGIAQVSLDVKTPFGNGDDDGTEGFGGVGMSLDILDTIDIYVEYLMFDTEVDSEMIGVGIRLDF